MHLFRSDDSIWATDVGTFSHDDILSYSVNSNTNLWEKIRSLWVTQIVSIFQQQLQ